MPTSPTEMLTLNIGKLIGEGANSVFPFTSVVQVFLLITLCSWFPGVQQNNLQLLILLYGSFIVFTSGLLIEPVRKFENYTLLIIVGTCSVVSFLINFKALPISLLYVFCSTALYYILFTRLGNYRPIIKTLVLVGFINIIISFLQKIGIDLIYVINPNNAVIQEQHLSMPGLMGRNYHLGYFLTVITPLAFYLNFTLGIIFSFLSFILIFLIGSFTLISIWGIMVAYSLYKAFGKKILILGIILLSVFTYVKKDKILNKVNARKDAYLIVLKEGLSNPFLGKGLGQFDIDTKVGTTQSTVDSSFNQLLKFVYELGLIPTLFILFTFIKYYKSLKVSNTYMQLALIALLVFPMFHETLRFSRFILLSILVFLFFEINGQNKRRVCHGE